MKHSKFADKVLQKTKKEISKDKVMPKILTPDGLFEAIATITNEYRDNLLK